MFIRTFPATSTHCQVTRTPFWTYQDPFMPPASLLNPPTPVLDPPGPIFTPTHIFTHKHLFSPTSTGFRLRTPPTRTLFLTHWHHCPCFQHTRAHFGPTKSPPQSASTAPSLRSQSPASSTSVLLTHSRRPSALVQARVYTHQRWCHLFPEIT